MLVLHRFEPHHLPGLLGVWSRRWGRTFPLDLALWRQNTERDPRHFRPEQCWIVQAGEAVVGGLALKVPDDPPAWPDQDPRHGWISFLVMEPDRDREIAPILLGRAVEWLRGARFARVSYGGDQSHFFPGAPDDDVALGGALETAGLHPSGRAYDLLGDLRHYSSPEDGERALRAVEATVRACERDDVPALLRFVDREFPGRWAYETKQRLQIEPSPADILIITRGAEVVGFCHIYHQGSHRLGPSIYWRRAIGDRYGGLGPIGVDRACRGRGLGRALLAFALAHLRRLGVEQTVIDWTTLVDYYGRLGFQIWRTYRSWQMDL
jgi:GNAT superfamily N-acetyltransferase